MDIYSWTPTAPYFATSLTPMTLQFTPYYPSTPFLSMFPISPPAPRDPSLGESNSQPPAPSTLHRGSTLSPAGAGGACVVAPPGAQMMVPVAALKAPVYVAHHVLAPTCAVPVTSSPKPLYSRVPLMGPVPGSDVYATPKKRSKSLSTKDPKLSSKRARSPSVSPSQLQARPADKISSTPVTPDCEHTGDSEGDGSCYTPSPVVPKKRGRPLGWTKAKSPKAQKVDAGKDKCLASTEAKVVLPEEQLESLNAESESDILNAYLGQSSFADPIKSDNGWLCSVCKKEYKHYKHARRHMLTHLGVRPHTCPNCRATFSRRDTMNRHRARCALSKNQKK